MDRLNSLIGKGVDITVSDSLQWSGTLTKVFSDAVVVDDDQICLLRNIVCIEPNDEYDSAEDNEEEEYDDYDDEPEPRSDSAEKKKGMLSSLFGRDKAV
jgi:hypothetical protein